jgi:hypothetical protein
MRWRGGKVSGMAEDSEKAGEGGAEARHQTPYQKAMAEFRATGLPPEGWEVHTRESGRRDLRRIPPKPPEVVDPATTKFDRLPAMRFVLLNPEACDTTEGHKWCRAWLEKAPAQFMAAYDELERAEESRKALPGDRPVTATESDRETRELLDRLLERHAESALQGGKS